jgi:hypothetical protein
VVLQRSFMQQNQRVYEDCCSCSSSITSYCLICIGWPQRGQASPSPEMTMDFFRLRFALNLPTQKTRTPAGRERSGEQVDLKK